MLHRIWTFIAFYFIPRIGYKNGQIKDDNNKVLSLNPKKKNPAQELN